MKSFNLLHHRFKRYRLFLYRHIQSIVHLDQQFKWSGVDHSSVSTKKVNNGESLVIFMFKTVISNFFSGIITLHNFSHVIATLHKTKRLCYGKS